MASVHDPSGCSETMLKQMILDSFPAYPYEGQIMAMLRDPQEYESEADDLDLVLAGKEWTGLQRAYIDANYDDYVLMSPSAVQAFLAAWLYPAIDDLGGSNHIRSGLLFHLNRVGDDLRYESGWARGLALLTRDQAQAVQALIRCTAATAFIKEHLLEAQRALAKLQSWFPGEDRF